MRWVPAASAAMPNFEVARKLVRESVLVDDAAVRKAQRALWEELHVVAEPAGATGLAALMAGAVVVTPQFGPCFGIVGVNDAARIRHEHEIARGR